MLVCVDDQIWTVYFCSGGGICYLAYYEILCWFCHISHLVLNWYLLIFLIVKNYKYLRNAFISTIQELEILVLYMAARLGGCIRLVPSVRYRKFRWTKVYFSREFGWTLGSVSGVKLYQKSINKALTAVQSSRCD